MVKKRGLGRGLDALLGHQTETAIAQGRSDSVKTLAIDLLKRSPFQPRQDFSQDALQALADSIRAQGIVQPIVVRAEEKSKQFEIIAGERRWRAAQMAGLDQVPVLVKSVSDKTVMCIALIENIQREDLNPLEEAQGLQRLLQEFDMTHEAIADAVGRSRSAVTNLLRLLELNPKVKQFLVSQQLNMSHARALLTLSSKKQIEVATKIVQQGLSVRATEALVKHLVNANGLKKTVLKTMDPDVYRLQNELSEKIAAKVNIVYRQGGKGELKIYYNSLDQLDGILKRIK